MSKNRDLVQHIQSQVGIVEAIEKTGVGTFPTLNHEQSFRGAHGTHSSSSTSHCVVYPEQNHWYCFSCQAGGGVVEWVLHAKFSGNYACYREAMDWVCGQFNVDNPVTPVDTPRYEAFALLTKLAGQWHQNLLKNDEMLEWVQDQWGLTNLTLSDLLIGYCDSTPELSHAEMTAAGLINDDNQFLLNGRIIFPYFKGGLVRWMKGRFPGDVPDGKAKYVSLASTGYVQPLLYNYDHAMSKPFNDTLVITEGNADAAMAYQCNIRCVALGTNYLAKDLTDDLVELCKRSDTKVIALDNEATGQGFKGAKKVAQALIDQGFDPFILQLPRGTKPKVDLCDFLKGSGEEGLAAIMLAKEAEDNGIILKVETLPAMEVDACPEQAESAKLEMVLETFAPLPDVSADKYLVLLAKKTGTARNQLKKLLDAVRKKNVQIDIEIDEEWESIPFLAQDFRYHPDIDVWRAHVCVYVPGIKHVTKGGENYTETTMVPLHIATDQTRDGKWGITKSKVLHSPTNEMKAHLPSLQALNHVETGEYAWSFKSKLPWSVKNFIEKTAKPVDIGELYTRIHGMLDKYVWMAEPRDKHLLTTFVFFTYVFMGFDASPYIHANGLKDSGKSTLLILLGDVCFNVVASSSLTAAAGVRIVHNNRPTLIIDEGERLRNPQPGTNDSELLAMALGGYKKAQTAKRLVCNKDTLEPTALYMYCPKVFGSINSLGDVLGSRAIAIDCRTADEVALKQLKDLTQDAAYLRADYQEIRDQLHIMALTSFRQIREIYDGFNRDDYEHLRNRMRELWLPLMATATWIDSVSGLKVAEILAQLSKEKIAIKKVTDADLDFGLQMLRAFWQVCQDRPDDIRLSPYGGEEGHHIFCTSLATNFTREQLIINAEWDEKRNRLVARTLIKFLRDINAIPNNARTNTMRSPNNPGERLPYIYLSLDKLKLYLQNKGIVDVDGSLKTIEVHPSNLPVDTGAATPAKPKRKAD